MDKNVLLEEEQKDEGQENFAEKNIELTCQIDDVLTYAIVHNGMHIVRDICIKNCTDADAEHLTLHIDSSNGLMEDFELLIEKIKPGEELHFRNLNVMVSGDYLASLTERSLCRVKVSVCLGEKSLASETRTITALAFDEWPGLQYTPELLAAFAMPNHPGVISLLQLASKYLKDWTQEPSLAGYQFGGPNRVKTMAAAAYAAIQQKNITYAEPPASFEEFGQRIRLADAVINQHLGTCMDMTLLYVACLEAMGLNPIMILMKGHIFAGVWLIDQSFSDMIMDDPSQLEKRMSKGIHELIVVECTAMCAGKTRSFDDAAAMAERNVADYENFAFVIDVKRARSMGIRPLPLRIRTDSGFEVQHEERQQRDVTDAPEEIGDVFDLSHVGEKEKVTKQNQWERKLLDLSMRNMLINMRLTKAVVPLLCSDVSILEDALADGEEFQVLPRPADMAFSGDRVLVETLGDLGPFADFISLEGKHRRLHSLYAERELNGCLTKLYRSAKTSLEENGASTLYLAVGLLRWFEGKKDAAARYAPVVLIPIEINRKSASKGYAMYMRDEDAQINITLLEFLKQSFDLTVHGLNPPPMDEHGLDISKIFAIIRHAVMNLPMWDIVEAGFIGNFSFSQFVMWNDIHNRTEFLEKNKIVNSLMTGAIDWDCTIPENLDTDEAYLPVAVDASQLRAINMAAGDVSFVLHGPPGTGKSQTITAMIANALTKGKTVLFVAEKMAALEVVQRRLAALGIQDFCLELHSNKAAKKSVLDQLKRGLEITASAVETDYNKKIQDIRRMRADLDGYANALHKKRTFGRSLRELMDTYEMIPDWGKDVRFSYSWAAALQESDVEHQVISLERLIAAGKAVGHPCHHPLSAVGRKEYDQRLKFDLETVILAYKSALEKFREDAKRFGQYIWGSESGIQKDRETWRRCASSVAAAEEIPAFLRNAESVDREFNTPRAYMESREVFAQKQTFFLSQWTANFLRMDMGNFREKYDQAGKKFFGKGKALAALTSELQAYASFQVVTDKIPAYLTDVSFYQKEEKEIREMEAQLPDEWKEILANISEKAELETYQSDIKERLQMMEQFSGEMKKLEMEGTLKECVILAKALLEDLEQVKINEKRADELLELNFQEDSEDWLESCLALCKCLLENADSMKSWVAYRQCTEECRANDLSQICDMYEEGLQHEEVIPVYLHSVYQAIILSIIESEPILNSFTGTGFNEKISQFKKLDQEFMELTKNEMLCRLSQCLPSSFDSVQVSKELNILRRAISSNGRGLSIRSLFEQIPHILTRFCPCMMMSPISVAQYLAAENDLFDIVIFDEASQLPTCKAVGVLARGRNAVIVGDPNQMPPTSFFAGNTIDEDNLDIEDLDSILDDCLALGMPQAHLHWHYRSRHESLIAFSNQEFYENSMLTFPSVNEREKKVNLVKTEGFFDRGKGRVNEGEAKAIVKEIKRRYCDPELRRQTVGVVTFNVSQQTLIEDLLQEEYQKDAEFDQWANTGEESLFVKNLENVQGDERDVILFSVAFGPDADGKLSLNFGPLNKAGGWKRLNVAVSRARTEMVVFTTMTADMINLKRTKSKGVEALKDFLEFAEKGKLQGEYTESRGEKRQGIMERICREISKAGFHYQRAVGHSRFKVDIAVLNPYNEDEYLLGIMLDGETYSQSRNTRDREVAQPSVLEGLGWHLYRIWTMDWWDNKEKEIEKLLQLLEKRKEEACHQFMETHREDDIEPEEEIQPEPQSGTALRRELEPELDLNVVPDKRIAGKAEEQQQDDPSIANLAYRTEEYHYAELPVTPMSTSDYTAKTAANQITERMQAIIDAEAPISYDRLAKKTLRSFDIARSSPATMEATEKALKKTVSKVSRQSAGKFYWRKDQDPNVYEIYRIDGLSEDKRALDDICQQELKNAICITLMEKGPLNKETLMKETVRTMGYGRSGAALTAAIERGLKFGRKTGEIVLDEDKNFILNRGNVEKE